MKPHRNPKRVPDWVGNLIAVSLLGVAVVLIILAKPLPQNSSFSQVLSQAFGLGASPGSPQQLANANTSETPPRLPHRITVFLQIMEHRR